MASTSSVGLRVLAGIFFVVAAIDVITEIAFVGGVLSHLDPGFNPGWMPPVISPEFFRTAPFWFLAAEAVVFGPIKIGLLIAAGFAFISHKRRGRVLANGYVVASLIESIVAGVAVSVHFGSIVAVLYLVLVFLLVNKVFAEDLKY
jgi:hypothetical protein